MDIFEQKKLLIRIITVLVIMNLSSISLFLWKEFSTEREPNFSQKDINTQEVVNILKRELELTEIQVNKIKKLRSIFHRQEHDLLHLIRTQRDSMNTEMFNKITNEKLVLLLAKRISENEYKMEMLRFQQSKELKLICTQNQLEKFEGLVIEIRDYFKPKHPRGLRK